MGEIRKERDRGKKKWREKKESWGIREQWNQCAYLKTDKYRCIYEEYIFIYMGDKD